MVAQNTFASSAEVFEAVYAHLIMEMVCAGEKHLARLILDEQKDLLVPNWYQDLWAVLYEGKMPFTLEKADTDAAETTLPGLDSEIVLNSRKMLAKLIRQKLVVVKPPSDKLIDLILRARSRHTTFKTQSMSSHQPARQGYIQKVKSHHMFDGDFQVQSACLSHPTSSSGAAEFLALGGSDGLIEIWNFKQMKPETEKLKFQKDGLFMVH